MASFNPADFRIDNLVDPSLIVAPIANVVLIQKPNPQQFVRVHPDEAYRFGGAILELADGKEHYLVSQSMFAELDGEYRRCMMVLAVHRYSTSPFIWPLKLSADGRENSWNDSAILAAKAAERTWVRVRSDQPSKSYLTMPAESISDVPHWSTDSMEVLLQKAFRDRIIDSVDHPVVAKLRGRN